jgi:hypothetical protein
MNNQPSKFLQENIITLLAYDDINAKLISSLVTPESFDGDYVNISKRLIEYINEFGSAPKDHIADLFEPILEGENKVLSKLYEKIILRISESYESINSEYVIKSLTSWLRYQELKKTILECAYVFQGDKQYEKPEDTVADVEVLLQEGMKKQFDVFDPGVFFGEEKSLKFLNDPTEAFITGIKELDNIGIGPARGELFVNIGIAGSGKSFFLLNLAKHAIMQRLKCCYVTLELSEEKVSQRFYQSFFGISKRDSNQIITNIDVDELGRIVGFKRKEVSPRGALSDPKIKDWLKDKLLDWGDLFRSHLIIKQFPDGTLTINQLKAYLDNLETHYNFIPDILIVDYADKMKLNKDELRHQLSKIYVDLRGIGVERNMAVATASQANRAGKSSKKIDSDNVAEAWDKIAIADNVITYTQTNSEKQLGLARLYCSKVRSEADGMTVLISQNYGLGQFCLKSALMKNQNRYMEDVNNFVNTEIDMNNIDDS